MTAQFKVGDLVVLTGEGCNQPARQLMAIWTVKSFAPEHRIRVYINPDMQLAEGLASLGEKVYPFSWLVSYKT